MKIAEYSQIKTDFPENGSVKQFPLSYSALILAIFSLNSILTEYIFLFSILRDIAKFIKHVKKYATKVPKTRIIGEIETYVTPFFQNIPGGEKNIHKKKITPIKIKFSLKKSKIVLKKIALVLYPNAIKTKKTPIENLIKNISMG